MIENIQHTHEISYHTPSISSKTAENEEDVVSKTAKELKENSQVENDHQTAESIKKEDNNVKLSAIVPRGDKLNEKAEKVNSLLEKACNQKQIDLIMHSNINTKRHLNRSRLHLNGYGKSIFIRNIRNYLTNFK